MHLHQSIVDVKTGKNIFSNADGTMSELCSLHHIGGLQKFIPEVLPLFAPNVNSFRRFPARYLGAGERRVGRREPYRRPARAGLQPGEPPGREPFRRRRRQPLPGAGCQPGCAATSA